MRPIDNDPNLNKSNPPPVWTVEGFLIEFYNRLGDYQNHKLCYEAIERHLMEKHNVTLFKNYQAFRTAKSKIYNQKKINRARLRAKLL